MSQQQQQIDISNLRIQPFGFLKVEQYLQELNLDQILNINDIEAHIIYQFRIQTQDQSYIIRKRVRDFQDLEQAVKHDMLLFLKHKDVTKESMDDTPKEKQQILFNYLKQVVNQDSVDNPNRDLLRFLEVSQVNYGDMRKLKEGFLKKKAGGRFSESRCTRCGTLWGRWSKRFFSVCNNGVMYCKGPFGQNSLMREMLLFDYNFSMLYGKKDTGFKKGIKLQFATRHLLLVAPDYFTYTEFIKSILDALKQCQYMQQHRFNSFAPVQLSQCKWYIDGQNYFSDVMDALLSAKEFVYITDWWMSPDLYLRRPIAIDSRDPLNQNSRLDRILKEIADKGVVVHILMYMEPTLALKHDSLHTQNFLKLLSRNIIILRHPSPIPQYWSHHEKILIVDGRVGFLGGLDLCFGRMDTQEHLLSDQDVRKQFWPGIDYANNRMLDFENVKDSHTTQIQRSDPRMPWHDIAIQVQGQSVSDLVRHFQQYWNHVIISQKFEKRVQNQVIYKKTIINSTNYTKLQDNVQQRIPMQQTLYSTLFTKYKNQVKDEFLHDDLEEVEEKKENEIENDFNRISFQKQRISTIFNKNKNCNKNFVEILEKISEQVEIQQSQQLQGEEIFEEKGGVVEQNQFIQPKIRLSLQKGNCQTQIIRSASNWSIGCSSKNTEFSIQLAYTQLILEAKYYIYIENQFFISSTSQNSYVENKVAEAIVRRIQQAALKKEQFKVIVFIPLLPGFAGEIDKESPILKVQLHWEYFTISRGGSSILERLMQDPNIPDPKKYIEFYSLRTHSKILDIPKTEQIYIHSKLMIVDDEYALIGSANINDRSLKGDRDSEIAIVVYDENKTNSYMNGQQTRVSKFAHELRVALYMEHFGLTHQQVMDPLSDELQEVIRFNTRRNTNIYRQVFACYPDDNIKKISDYQQFKQQGNLELYDLQKNDIIGHAVEFPLEFLCEENLKISILQKEILLPDFNFT